MHAVLLLFPITDKSEKAKQDEGTRIATEGQTCSEKVYYMKQTIGNACGTIGILHAVGNNLGSFDVKEGSYFADYFAKTAGMTPVERAAYLEEDDGIEAAHGAAVAAGDTRCPTLDEKINLHFVVRPRPSLPVSDARRRLKMNWKWRRAPPRSDDQGVVARDDTVTRARASE